jgi:hypothetical protein
MSEETEAKALVAGSIMAMAMVPISIKVAMHHAGFSEKEIENRSLQQKVRRKGSKAPPSTVSFTPSNESSSVSTFSHSQAASSITPTIRQDSMPSSSILVSSILPSSGSIHRQSRSRTRRANEDLLQSSQHLQTLLHLSQEPQAEGENGEDSKPPAKKKSRKSPVERQKTDAEACLLNKKQSDAFKLATSRYALSLTLEAGDPEKKSCETICDEVNAMKETSVSRRTVARAVREGRAGASPLKRGKVASIPKSDWTSLKDAYSTFIMLEQANKRNECTPKRLRRLVGQCLQAGGYFMGMEEITSRLKSQTAHIISAGKGDPQEFRRLVWTTFQNLNQWFATFHEIVVRLGFARERTAEDPPSPEVIFFEGQEDRIINFDESPVSIDNTSGERGGRPPTTFFSTSLPSAATAANKTGYTCTIICGSTAAGTPLPPHLQLKTAAQSADRERINIAIFEHVKRV